MSFKPEVRVNHDDKWYDNSLRFATHDEADSAARDLASRWTSVRAHRVTECEDPVNRRWVAGYPVMLEEGEQ